MSIASMSEAHRADARALSARIAQPAVTAVGTALQPVAPGVKCIPKPALVVFVRPGFAVAASRPIPFAFTGPSGTVYTPDNKTLTIVTGVGAGAGVGQMVRRISMPGVLGSTAARILPPVTRDACPGDVDDLTAEDRVEVAAAIALEGDPRVLCALANREASRDHFAAAARLAGAAAALAHFSFFRYHPGGGDARFEPRSGIPDAWRAAHGGVLPGILMPSAMAGSLSSYDIAALRAIPKVWYVENRPTSGDIWRGTAAEFAASLTSFKALWIAIELEKLRDNGCSFDGFASRPCAAGGAGVGAPMISVPMRRLVVDTVDGASNVRKLAWSAAVLGLWNDVAGLSGVKTLLGATLDCIKARGDVRSDVLVTMANAYREIHARVQALGGSVELPPAF